MKGKAVVHGKPNIEIVYYMKKSGPRLKLAMVYNNEYLHLIVNQFDQKQMIKSTWMKFSEIGNQLFVSLYYLFLCIIIRQCCAPDESIFPYDLSVLAQVLGL